MTFAAHRLLCLLHKLSDKFNDFRYFFAAVAFVFYNVDHTTAQWSFGMRKGINER